MCSANALYPQLQTEIYRGNDLSSLVGFREESQASERFISLSLRAVRLLTYHFSEAYSGCFLLSCRVILWLFSSVL